MNMFKKIKASVYDLEFHKEVRSQGIGSVLKYYLKLALLLALAALIVSSFTLVPKAFKGLHILKSEVLAHYPKDLEIKIVKGIVSTNVSEPYALPLPDAIKNDFNSPEAQAKGAPAIENAVVINTKLNRIATVDEFKQMKTFVFLGKDYALRYDKKDSIVYQGLSKAPDFAATHASLEKILGYADYLIYLIPVLCFIGVFILVMFQLIWILLVALIFFIIQKIAGKGLSYASSYKSCAYAYTVPIIVGLIALLFSVPEKFFVLDVIAIIIAFVNTPKHIQAE